MYAGRELKVLITRVLPMHSVSLKQKAIESSQVQRKGLGSVEMLISVLPSNHMSSKGIASSSIAL